MFDGELFGQQMAEMVRSYVDSEIGPLKAENAELRAQIEDLRQRAPEKGDRGEPGPQGEPGPAGEVDMEAVRSLVEAAVSAIPPAEKGDQGEPGARGEPGAPGEVDMEQVRSIIAAEVAQLPPPERGEPGPKGDAGEPGKDCDMAAVERAIGEQVAKAVAELPAPENGRDGIGLANALKDERGHLMLVMSNGDTKDLGKIVGENGRDGKHGLNATDFDINVMEDGRTLEFSLDQGETRHTFEIEFPFPIYRGVWEEKGVYSAGDMTTWAGSLWHCDDPKGLKPGETDSGWRIAAKKGRDGKDGGK